MRFQEARDKAKELGVWMFRPGFPQGIGSIHPHKSYNLTPEELDADDWEVQEPKKKMRIFYGKTSKILFLCMDDIVNDRHLVDVTKEIKELLKEE